MDWAVLGWVVGIWGAALAAFAVYLWREHRRRMGGDRPPGP
jgi:hypothetical protein